MSLDSILAAILDTGKATIQEIENRAQLQASAILETADREAQSIREQARAAALEPASRERARMIQKARLDALQVVGDVREALVDSALEQCCQRLAHFRSDALWPEVYHHLFQETFIELEHCLAAYEPGARICLEADPRDRALLDALIAHQGLSLTVNYTLSGWGGMIARTEDGRVAVINTLESRLERATPSLRRYLAAFFEADNPASVESQVVERSVAM